MGVNLCPRTGGRGKDTIKILSLFEPTFSEARRVGTPRNIASRAEQGELTRFFKIRSNLFENVHQIRV